MAPVLKKRARVLEKQLVKEEKRQVHEAFAKMSAESPQDMDAAGEDRIRALKHEVRRIRKGAFGEQSYGELIDRLNEITFSLAAPSYEGFGTKDVDTAGAEHARHEQSPRPWHAEDGERSEAEVHIDLMRQLVADAHRSFDATTDAFEQGEVTYRDVMTAHDALMHRMDRFRAVADLYEHSMLPYDAYERFETTEMEPLLEDIGHRTETPSPEFAQAQALNAKVRAEAKKKGAVSMRTLMLLVATALVAAVPGTAGKRSATDGMEYQAPDYPAIPDAPPTTPDDALYPEDAVPHAEELPIRLGGTPPPLPPDEWATVGVEPADMPTDKDYKPLRHAPPRGRVIAQTPPQDAHTGGPDEELPIGTPFTATPLEVPEAHNLRENPRSALAQVVMKLERKMNPGRAEFEKA